MVESLEGNDWFDPMRAAEVCLVPNIVVPKDFRVPEFTKYTGLECPNTHHRSYCNKMVEVIHDDKMLIYFFFKIVYQALLQAGICGWKLLKLRNGKIW
jgi:hypothetical protein